jgi:4-hydroxy-tetrahydrodipicolinate reductase
MKLAISGATGRMGLAVIRLAHAAGDVQIVGGCCGPDDPGNGRDLGELSGVGAEVAIDFSVASVAAELATLCARQKVALVSGTTNLDAAAQRALDRAAEAVPVLWAPNMSLGVQVLAELVQHAVRRLGAEFDVEIAEIHHRKKVDAPSGTAKRLAEAAKSVRPELQQVDSRAGDVGARSSHEIGVFGLRGGDVIGDHTVFLFGNGERLELTHRASQRDLFAHGALRAARFLIGKPPGRYTIADVLG